MLTGNQDRDFFCVFVLYANIIVEIGTLVGNGSFMINIRIRMIRKRIVML